LIGLRISVSLLVLLGSSAVAGPLPITKQHKSVETDSADSVLRQAVTVLLREADGQHLGSGVLVAVAPGGRWVVTNRHVVGTQSTVCVVTADRSVRAALVMPPKTREKQRELDLALIWLPSKAREAGLVAVISEKAPKAEALPLVVSTGFPTPINSPMDGQAYSERPGLLVPLLKAPLEEGLDLAYTAIVDKGMSGGGIFLGRELIGINSAHREPLWPGRWRNGSGRAVDEQLNQKLDLVSLGVSSKNIARAVKAAALPSGAELDRLINVDCYKAMDQAKPVNPSSNTPPNW
jgi:hypothetical protein